jgi:hypothetical protein
MFWTAAEPTASAASVSALIKHRSDDFEFLTQQVLDFEAVEHHIHIAVCLGHLVYWRKQLSVTFNSTDRISLNSIMSDVILIKLLQRLYNSAT